jgi:glycosyltransferase involved in cell wall biosynthesis
MKILFSSNVSWSIYNFRKSFLKILQNNDHKIYTVANRDEYSDKLINEGFDFRDFHLNNNKITPLVDLYTIFRYYRIYKKISPDIICHNAIKPNIYGTIAASFLGIPVINNISGLGTLFIKKSFSTYVAKFLYKFSQKYASTVFFQNNDDLSLFLREKIVHTNNAKLIPGSGVDTSIFLNEKRKISRTFNFIFIGRFLTDKGLLELYDAVTNLSNIKKNFKVIMVGNRYELNKTCISLNQLNLFKSSKFFSYVGHTDNVYCQLLKANCLILPSYREGLSKVLIEAGSSGIPCITTDVPGCKEVIIDGHNGFLVKPKDSKSIMNAMIKIMEMSKLELYNMGLNARKNVEERFSSKIVNKIYIDEIYKLLKI